MEVETAFRRHLMGLGPVSAYVGQKVYRFRLETKIDGTGGRALVVTRQPGWRSREPNTQREFPRLWIDCLADPSRTAAGAVAALDGEDKALALARVVKTSLNNRLRGVLVGGFGSNPGLLVAGCWLAAEPRLLNSSDAHSGDTPLGDVVVARTEWNVICSP